MSTTSLIEQEHLDQVASGEGPDLRHWNNQARNAILAGGQPQGIFSHHGYSVSLYPQLADDPDIIIPLTFREHFFKHHGGNWRNPTHGVPLRPDLPDDF